ncbi:MAG: tRNA (adenosine(37)-N6)-dimethylallyltransferase MiaA [Patescibacteria group bacterium]|nr:tRNA (adenosine(37)-N6)-dimethylallyltransferase MiaA [Patescibacteria group bacterium]
MNITQKNKKSQLQSNNKVIVILGPTASGKTKMAIRLAKKYNGEIISADSRQVYRGMDIGSGKDLVDYGKIKYHLIDIVSPKTNFSVSDWQKKAIKIINELHRRGKIPIVCGGSGLYLNALVEGYNLPPAKRNASFRNKLNKLTLSQLLKKLKMVDLATYEIIDRNNRRRVERALEIYYQTGEPKSALVSKNKLPYVFLQIGLNFPRDILRQRINKRLKERLAKNLLVKEVGKLKKSGVSWQRLESFGLEYRYVAKYLQHKITRDEMVEKLGVEIYRYAKRQRTWFRRNEDIFWLNSFDQVSSLVQKFIA